MNHSARDEAAEVTWRRVELARHEQRPYALDYIRMMCDDWFELHGDRSGGEDRAIIGGPARIDGRAVMVIGHQKGRSMAERNFRNYGMAHPEGYRKAMRLMKQAERFHMPVLTLVDTPGAYPGVEAERSGQAWAIAESLVVMADLATPIVSVVIGEGGSGGALALALGDKVLMMENAIYSVASPEASAAITWRDSGMKKVAAAAQRITSDGAVRIGVVDGIISEPVPAHLDPEGTAARLKTTVLGHFEELMSWSIERLLASRYWRFRRS
ncbi:MAG: acetyl-CoA carboxylase carboxyltransferase subunit alpha [Candidatus Dormibacteria bacterium]